MLDPVTLGAAVSAATTAYNGIKKAISIGREIEDLSGELGRWMTAVSDVDNVHKNANNPSAIDKLFNGSIEQVAIESFAAKKKLSKQLTIKTISKKVNFQANLLFEPNCYF